MASDVGRFGGEPIAFMVSPRYRDPRYVAMASICSSVKFTAFGCMIGFSRVFSRKARSWRAI
jgi:hypothetical protein